ncbi:MAG: phospho-N-acetylmuramoyl-pentapeptide-transferase [Pyrinomonadaceae bacterium]|nr:phospho-N-acetylmuramoyl-pentapeptide-transferase [Pyrinomonadaceae bacterium]
MLYHLFYEYLYLTFGRETSAPYLVKLFNVFQYITFRTAYATITALLLSLFCGKPVIAWLTRLKVGQSIRAEVELHQAKKGTPTMGGVLILGSVLISTLLWARLGSLYVWLAIFATAIFGLVGFLDDYIKVVKKRSQGLTSRQKLIGQLVAALIVWSVLYLFTDYQWNVSIPFLKWSVENPLSTYIYPLGYLIFIIIVLLGSSNAVNLTDGLDGLAISVTFIAMTAMTALTYVSSDGRWARELDLIHRPETAELTIFCGTMVGASLGFLWFNAPKAQVFMGDVGSLAIGGAIGTIAILTKNELLLVLVGGVFVIEALSVMIQVSVFKLTKRRSGVGKRIFRMAPLHHHFETGGMEESKVVFRFVIVAILFALLGLSTLKLR